MVAAPQKALGSDVIPICPKLRQKAEEVLCGLIQRYGMVSVPGVHAGEEYLFPCTWHWNGGGHSVGV